MKHNLNIQVRKFLAGLLQFKRIKIKDLFSRIWRFDYRFFYIELVNFTLFWEALLHMIATTGNTMSLRAKWSYFISRKRNGKRSFAGIFSGRDSDLAFRSWKNLDTEFSREKGNSFSRLGKNAFQVFKR